MNGTYSANLFTKVRRILGTIQLANFRSLAVALTPVVDDWVLYLVVSLELNRGRLISSFGSSNVSVMPGAVNLGIS